MTGTYDDRSAADAHGAAAWVALVRAGVDRWRDHGLCRQTDPEVFYPLPGGSAAAAKQICARCPVRAQCLAEALEADERHGVWGGTTPTERARLRRHHRPAMTSGRGRCAA